MHYFYYISILLSFLYDSTTIAFNFEDRIPIVKLGPDGSLFGFSVAEHFTSESGNPLLIVGAPTDERASWDDEKVTQPGGIYKCTITQGSSDCDRVQISTGQGHTLTTNSSNQWLGVIVRSQKPGGKVAVCAHRYTIRKSSRGVVTSEAGLGRCFLLDNYLNKPDEIFNYEWIPCKGLTDNNGVYSAETYGYCQAGTSVDFSPSEEEDILFGAPGSFSWTGAIHTDQLSPTILFAEPLWNQILPEVERVGSRRNSYLGFSVASGKLANSDKFNFVAGAPRANDTGAVTIFVKKKKDFESYLHEVEKLYGDKIASAFGYEVKVFDINGDGRDDLLVGAPQYYDAETNMGGAVYIYINKGLDLLGPEPTQVLYGKARSSFGLSIANIGDINMDGANDVAIGAPGDNLWNGTVYIFHGDNVNTGKGVYEEPAQIIEPASILDKKKNITGFGYSLSGGLDMDSNGYPDIAVGTTSDHAILFRTRPIVDVAVELTTPSKQITADVHRAKDEDKEEITLSRTNTIQVVVFEVKVCMNYTSTPNTFDDRVNINYNLTLDATRVEKDLPTRATFDPLDNEGSILSDSMGLYRQSANRNKCKTHKAYLRNDLQDKLSPLNITVSFEMEESDPTVPTGNTLPQLKPVLSNRSRKRRSIGSDLQINFSKNCGGDEICESRVSWSAHYVMHIEEEWRKIPNSEENANVALLKLGKEDQIGMELTIANDGEDAHQAQLHIMLPKELQYVNVERVEDPKLLAPHCNPQEGNHSMVLCDLGNPLLENGRMTIRLRLDKNPSIYLSTGFNVTLQFTTTSQQPGHDKPRDFEVQVRVEAQLEINGYPDIEQQKFGGEVVGESAVKRPEDAGLIIRHTYEVKNSGTSPADNVRVHVQWPLSIANGKWLFYLLEATVKQNGGTCDLPDQVNPINIPFSSSYTSDPSKPKRLRRETAATSQNGENEVKRFDKAVPPPSASVTLKCGGDANCTEIVCDLGSVEKKSKKFIYLYAILWNSTFLEEYYGVAKISVWSSAHVSIDRHNIQYSEHSHRNYSVVTDVLSEEVIPPEPHLPLWIILAAAVAGVVVLVVIVLLLWRCGFFKRKQYGGETYKARRRKQASKKAEESEALY